MQNRQICEASNQDAICECAWIKLVTGHAKDSTNRAQIRLIRSLPKLTLNHYVSADDGNRCLT